MKYKIKEFGLLNKMKHRYKNSKFLVDILQILKIENLIRIHSINIEIQKLNEIISSLILNIKEILKIEQINMKKRRIFKKEL